MLEYIEQEANLTLTENGAVTYETTGSDCLDLFATIGALRTENDEEIIVRFMRAYTEDADTAMKLLFFARDIRGGLGERRVFRTILKWLANNKPESVQKNIGYIAEYGRFDDLLSLFDTVCEKEMLAALREQYEADMKELENGHAVSLLGKWLPSVNASNAQTVRYAKRIARSLNLSDAQYRKSLSALRACIHIVENNLREKDYSFDYEKQPSKALYKYRKAFMRNDAERYNEFISKVNIGEAKLHAETIAPYELVEPYLINGYCHGMTSRMKEISAAEEAVLNATWNSLPDFGGDENAIAVVDTSGSMYCAEKPSPAAVALSLGLYFAEHSKGLYKNHFIEFSERPKLIELKGNTFADKLRYAASFSKIANTNLEAVFDLVLSAAVKNKLPQEELPAKLVIISDMEFDCCVEHAEMSNFRNAKAKYDAYGYKLPDIVFWNVASRNRQQPVTRNEQGVVLVSGATPRLFSMIAGGCISPYVFMMEVLNGERYAKIAA